jgi:7-cyano-7-deazaguanine reductase
MQNFTKNPLGRATENPRQYSPETLFAIPRIDARKALGIDYPLPFRGEDIWNAWEFSWLDSGGRPQIAVAEIRVPADSPNLIESKSLKLYLNSFAMTRLDSKSLAQKAIAGDLGARTGSDVSVSLHEPGGDGSHSVGGFPGPCIDDAAATFDSKTVDPAILQSDSTNVVREELHSNLLRSNCPVTGQPDTGSILIRYRGPKIDRGCLLEYLVSFRHLEEFHENCVERVFIDLKSRCAAAQLSVYARYNRRGGIDINPFRSDFEERPDNLRLVRQ